MFWLRRKTDNMSAITTTIKQFVERELVHAERFPHAPVKGTFAVLPIMNEGGGLTLQANGWNVTLSPDGTWVICDTAKEAAQADQVPPQPE